MTSPSTSSHPFTLTLSPTRGRNGEVDLGVGRIDIAASPPPPSHSLFIPQSSSRSELTIRPSPFASAAAAGRKQIQRRRRPPPPLLSEANVPPMDFVERSLPEEAHPLHRRPPPATSRDDLRAAALNELRLRGIATPATFTTPTTQTIRSRRAPPPPASTSPQIMMAAARRSQEDGLEATTNFVPVGTLESPKRIHLHLHAHQQQHHRHPLASSTRLPSSAASSPTTVANTNPFSPPVSSSTQQLQPSQPDQPLVPATVAPPSALSSPKLNWTLEQWRQWSDLDQPFASTHTPAAPTLPPAPSTEPVLDSDRLLYPTNVLLTPPRGRATAIRSIAEESKSDTLPAASPRHGSPSPSPSPRASPPISSLHAIAGRAIANLHQRLLVKRSFESWLEQWRWRERCHRMFSLVATHYDRNFLIFHYQNWRRLFQFRQRQRRLIIIEQQAVERYQMKQKVYTFKSWHERAANNSEKQQEVELIWTERGHRNYTRRILQQIYSHWLTLSQHCLGLADRSYSHFLHTHFRRIFYPWLRHTRLNQIARQFHAHILLRAYWRQWFVRFDRLERCRQFMNYRLMNQLARCFYQWHQQRETNQGLKEVQWKKWKRLFYLERQIRAWKKQRAIQAWIQSVQQYQIEDEKCEQYFGQIQQQRDHQRLVNSAWQIWCERAEERFDAKAFIRSRRLFALTRWKSFLARRHRRYDHRDLILLHQSNQSKRQAIRYWRKKQLANDAHRVRMDRAQIFHEHHRMHAYVVRWLIWKNDELILKTQTNLVQLIRTRPFVRTLRLHAQFRAYLKRMRQMASGYSVRRLGGVHWNEWAGRAESYCAGKTNEMMPEAFWRTSNFIGTDPKLDKFTAASVAKKPREPPKLAANLPTSSSLPSNSLSNSFMPHSSPAFSPAPSAAIHHPSHISTADLGSIFRAAPPSQPSGAANVSQSAFSSSSYYPSAIRSPPRTGPSNLSQSGQIGPIDHRIEISSFPRSEFISLPTKASTQIILDAVKGLPSHHLPYPPSKVIPSHYSVSDARAKIEQNILDESLARVSTRFHMPLPVEPLAPILKENEGIVQPIRSPPRTLNAPSSTSATALSTSSLSLTVAASNSIALSSSLKLASHSLDPITQRKSNRQKLEMMLHIAQKPAEQFYREQAAEKERLAREEARAKRRAENGGIDPEGEESDDDAKSDDLSNYRHEELSRLHFDVTLCRRFFEAWSKMRGMRAKETPIETRVGSRLLLDYFSRWSFAYTVRLKFNLISTHYKYDLLTKTMSHWRDLCIKRQETRIEQEEVLNEWLRERRKENHFRAWHLSYLESLNERMIAKKAKQDRKIALLSIAQPLRTRRALSILSRILPEWHRLMVTTRGERLRDERLEVGCRQFQRTTLTRRMCRGIVPLWHQRAQQRARLRAEFKVMLIQAAFQHTSEYKRWKHGIQVKKGEELLGAFLQRYHIKEVWASWRQKTLARRQQAEWDERYQQLLDNHARRILREIWSHWFPLCTEAVRVKLHETLVQEYSIHRQEQGLNRIFHLWFNAAHGAIRARKEKAEREEREARRNQHFLSMQVAFLCHKFALLRKTFKKWREAEVIHREQTRLENEIHLPVVPVFKDEQGLILQTEVMHSSPTKTETPLPYGIIYQPYLVQEVKPGPSPRRTTPLKLLPDRISLDESFTSPRAITNLVLPPEPTPESVRLRRSMKQFSAAGIDVTSSPSQPIQSPSRRSSQIGSVPGLHMDDLIHPTPQSSPTKSHHLPVTIEEEKTPDTHWPHAQPHQIQFQPAATFHPSNPPSNPSVDPSQMLSMSATQPVIFEASPPTHMPLSTSQLMPVTDTTIAGPTNEEKFFPDEPSQPPSLHQSTAAPMTSSFASTAWIQQPNSLSSSLNNGASNLDPSHGPEFVGFALPAQSSPTRVSVRPAAHSPMRVSDLGASRGGSSSSALAAPFHPVDARDIHVPLRSVLSSNEEIRLEPMARPMVPRSRFAAPKKLTANSTQIVLTATTNRHQPPGSTSTVTPRITAPVSSPLSTSWSGPTYESLHQHRLNQQRPPAAKKSILTNNSSIPNSQQSPINHVTRFSASATKSDPSPSILAKAFEQQEEAKKRRLVEEAAKPQRKVINKARPNRF